MDEQDLMVAAKIITGLLFLISLGLLVHYEYNVKHFYSTHPETLDRHTQQIENYVNRTGCSSKREVYESTRFGYLQSWYLLHKLTEQRRLIHYPEQGNCINHLRLKLSIPN